MPGTELPILRDESGPAAGVVTLTLTQPGRPVIVMDRAMLRSLDAALDRIAAGPAPRGFVLASDSRVFVAGADLREIVGLSDAELDEYMREGQRILGRIARLPCTTVAAINGAALGGGLEMAMYCDHLIASAPVSSDPAKPPRPYPIGLPEASLSICPGWGGSNLLPARMDFERAVRMTATGVPFTVVDAREAGLVEDLVPQPAALLARAKQLAAAPKPKPRATPKSIGPDCQSAADCAASLATLSRLRAEPNWSEAARGVFDCVETGLKRGWQAALDVERKHLIRLRNSEAGRAGIKAFLEKSAAR